MASAITQRHILAPHRRRRQNVTRQQLRSFPFLDLPPELRNIIYEYAFDVSVAQKLIDGYHKRIGDTENLPAVKAPMVYYNCPTILLINKQIHAEANFFVQNHGLTFDHGLIDLADVTDFVPASVFRNVGSITVDDSGHHLFQDNILAASWTGYVCLLEQLAKLLSPGHRLKSLTISLTNPELVPHVTTCWNSEYYCGFRASLLRACNALRNIHNVRSVTLRGLPEPLAQQLKARMEAPAVNFFDLPRELRDQIYGEALDWSDISKQLALMMIRWTDKNKTPPYPERSTPTVLLLNRQITVEALAVLRKKPLVLTFPRDHGMQKQDKVPNMERFITRRTLQTVQHLVIKIESWEWVFSLDFFMLAFHTAREVATITPQSTALKTIHFSFSDSIKDMFLANPNQYYPDDTLHTNLSNLAKIRGLSKITIAGDLPACYAEPLAQIMQMSNDAKDLPKLKSLRGDGSVVELED